jgi:tRNA uridine 5-carboxymethylaminomethyl modification enzyme
MRTAKRYKYIREGRKPYDTKNINYDSISGLSNEVKRKLKDVKPLTFGQALRIDWCNPSCY